MRSVWVDAAAQLSSMLEGGGSVQAASLMVWCRSTRSQKKRLEVNKTRYTAEALDEYMSFQENNNDHQIRCIVAFQGQLNIEVLREAILRSFVIVPIMGCRYGENSLSAYWESIDPEESRQSVVNFVVTERPESEIEKFLAGQIDYHRGPQVHAGLVRSKGVDTLCIVINHMACDGTAFKNYLLCLGRLYTQLARGEAVVQTIKVSNDRSLGKVLERFAFKDRIRLALKKSDTDGEISVAHFPRDASGTVQAIFVRQTLEKEMYRELIHYSRQNGFTVNDIALAAYYSALYEIVGSGNRILRIPCMVDLRRYVASSEAVSFANLASMIETDCGNLGGFLSTVKEINRQMKARKEQNPGLAGLPLMALLHRLLPHGLFKHFMKRIVKYPEISMSNVGIVPNDLCFDSIAIADAYILTALKKAPSFQLSFSTYRETVTFSVSLLGIEKDRDTIAQFFKKFFKQLPLSSSIAF